VDLHESSRSVGGEEPHDGPERPPGQGKEIMSSLPRSRPKPPKTRRKPRSRARPRPPAPDAAKAASPRTPARTSAVSFPKSEPAPGLPRLAIDGVVEAAKLPLKVGAEISSRALSAFVHGLRRG
jgi:hypothetical protein